LFYLNNIKLNSIQNLKGDNGFGTVCKIDAGYYAQGIFFLFIYFHLIVSNFKLIAQ